MKSVINLLLLVFLAMIISGCSKNHLEPEYHKSKDKIIIHDVSFPNMEIYNDDAKTIKINNFLKSSINLFSSKVHYISTVNKDDFIVYKLFNVGSSMGFSIKLDNPLRYYDKCVESSFGKYRTIQCSGKYLDEELKNNRIIFNQESSMETLQLSENYFNIMVEKLHGDVEVDKKIDQREKNDRLKIYKGLGKIETQDIRCPKKLYLTIFKDFSSNINPYALTFRNGEIDTTSITEINVFSDTDSYLEGRYRMYISENLQCRGTFKAKRFIDYK